GVYRFAPKPMDPDVNDVHPGGVGDFPNRQVLAVADLNGDGNGDLIYSGWSVDAKRFEIGTMMGLGNGKYTEPVFRHELHLTAVTTGDFTGDGIPDLIGVATTEGQVWMLPGVPIPFTRLG